LDIQNIIADIRQTLKLDPDWADSIPSWNKAKNFFAQKIEDIGITVVFNSVVGNNTHRKITVDECRGFVLVDDIAPFMFVNSADYKSAQMFTLAHELAHIWIGESAGFDFRQMLPAQNETEILCDKIAAEFLVPSEIFNSIWMEYNNFEKLARHFKVGQIVIARRALDLGKISRSEFFEFYREYSSQEKVKKENREPGGDFYNTQKKRLGLRFLNNINQAVRENKLLVRDAYQLTGLKGNSFNNLVEGYLY
jgi:Zn-dependent peptidase ImmA (M78 family)